MDSEQGRGPVQWGGGEPLRGDIRLPRRQPREAQHEAGGAQRRRAEGGVAAQQGALKIAASKCISARDCPGRHRKVTLTPGKPGKRPGLEEGGEETGQADCP